MGRAEFDPDPAATSYYERLGVSEAADADRVDTASKHVKSKYHPDRHGGDGDARERWDRIKSAEAVLTEAADRAAYDTFLDRFGAEEGTRAFETWEARSRPEPPEQWSPRDDTSAATRDSTTTTANSSTSSSAGSAGGSTATASTATGSSGTNTAGASASSAATGTGTSDANTSATTRDSTTTTPSASGGDRWSVSARDLTWALYCGLYAVTFGFLLVISDLVRLPATIELVSLLRAGGSRLVALSWYGDATTLATATAILTVFALAFGGVVIRIRPYYVHEIDRKVWKETARTFGFALASVAVVGVVGVAVFESGVVSGIDVGSVVTVPSGSTPVVIAWLFAAVCVGLLGLVAVYYGLLFVSLAYVGLGLVVGLFLNRTFDLHGLRPALVSGSLLVSVLTIVPIAPVLMLLTGGAVLSIFYDANL